MPQALQIDRQLFSALVLQGFNAFQVANKLGMKPTTARTWIKRMGLRATEATVKGELATAGKQELAVQVAEDTSKQVRDRLGKALDRDSAFLDTVKPVTSDKQAFTRYSRLAPVLAAAEKVYGWRSDDTPQATISFSRLDLHLHSDLPVATPVPQVLDIESTPVESTPQVSPPQGVENKHP